MRFSLFIVLASILLGGPRGLTQVAPSSAQPSSEVPTAPPPAGNTMLLWPNGAPGAVGDTAEDKPRIEAFLASGAGMHSAVIVVPGGGYTHLSYGKEGVEVARWLNQHGVSAFVLTYRLGPRYAYPVPLEDGKRAVRWVRSHVAEYGLDAGKIGVLGFSAGGHLVGYLGTHFDGGDAAAVDPVEQMSSRPDFVVDCYGQLTTDMTLPQSWTLKFLVGENPSAGVLADISPETHVTAQTPPFFLWSTSEDKTINSINSARFYEALKRAGIPAELHIFEAGPHGSGLAPQYPGLKMWPMLLQAWMQSHGWMP